MTAEEQSTRDLITDIEKKDRRFRMAQSIFMSIVLTTLVAATFALFSLVIRVNANTVQLTNYLRCTSLTPVQDRTTAFVTKCFQTDSTITPTK